MKISKYETAIIDSYKLKHTPYTQNTNYREKLHDLATQFAHINGEKEFWTLEPSRKDYYCYIYLDPRYFGNYEYICPSGKVLKFRYRPFYVGKGRGRRAYYHIREAKAGKKNHKCNILNKLAKLRLAPIIIQTAHYDEYLCLAFEVDCIAGIGRYNQKLGPLANLTDGGKGGSGSKHTEQWKKEASLRSTGKYHTQETKDYLRYLRSNTRASNATRTKMRKSAPKTHSAIHNANVATGLRGKRKSKAHCLSMSLVRQGKKLGPTKASKKVIAEGKLYRSLTEASEATGIYFYTLKYRLTSKSFPNYYYVDTIA